MKKTKIRKSMEERITRNDKMGLENHVLGRRKVKEVQQTVVKFIGKKEKERGYILLDNMGSIYPIEKVRSLHFSMCDNVESSTYTNYQMKQRHV